MNMTKNKILAGFIGIGLLLLVVLGVYLTRHHVDGTNPQQKTTSPKVANINEVVEHPDRFRGFIGVDGTIIKSDESNASFALGCEDACIMMPVTYKGQIPDAGSEVIVYGEIKKSVEDKYFFEGQKVKVK